MPPVLRNVVAFQTGWFACVLGGAHAMPWIGPLLAAFIVALHLRGAANWQKELQLIAILGLCGSLFDQFLLSLGWIQYPASGWPVWLLPFWMTCLWMLFATTLNVSLRWLHGHHFIALLFGLLGGPLAYLAGQKLGAMQLLEPAKVLLVLGVFWGLMMPAMQRLAAGLDGYNTSKISTAPESPNA